MTLTTERQQFAAQNEMSMEFVNWFFDEKKEGCGNAWFIMAAAMWEGWKGRDDREAQPVAFTSPAQLKKYPNEQREAYGQYSEKFCVPLYTVPPAPAARDGWKLVPAEPTEEMLRAAYRNGEAYSVNAYRAMLAAAPEGGSC